MTKTEEEKDIEIPGEEDENVGDVAPKKKREKKRKSKEERMAERRVTFWTLVIILLITLGFWIGPHIGDVLSGKLFSGKSSEQTDRVQKIEPSGNKNYLEITL